MTQYLIKKGDYYYRPFANGYTAHQGEAGRYSFDEAEALTYPNGPDGPRDGLSYIEAPATPADYRPAAHILDPNPLAAELEARLRAMPQGGTGLWLPSEEIQALIDSLNYQDGRLAGHIDVATYQKKELEAARAALAADKTLISRMIAVIKLARHFSMRAISLRGDAATKDYLARYIDRGDWGPLAWPDGIEQAGQALIGLGYLRIDGFVQRPEGQEEGKENVQAN